MSEKTSPERALWGVEALCLALRDHLDARFNPVGVQGEISGFTKASSGHCYFSLQDPSGNALLRCAMFKRAASQLDFSPRNGMAVELYGRIGVYESRGDLQIVVETMRQAGLGQLMERFLQLKAKLEAEGLFDETRKRPILESPRKIGVISSSGAAALQDVLTALARRVPHLPVVFAHAPVQGATAASELAQAIERMQSVPELDVILLVRGGGSLEDLWAFNEEVLVRAVASSQIPLICGVGHETDFSLCDFAADLRAPTPTAAAELAARPREEALLGLAAYQQALSRAVLTTLNRSAQELDYWSEKMSRPSHFAAQAKSRIQLLQQSLSHAGVMHLRQLAQKLSLVEAQLQALNPHLVLERGYSILQNQAGEVIRHTGQVQLQEVLQAQLADGKLELQVSSV